MYNRYILDASSLLGKMTNEGKKPTREFSRIGTVSPPNCRGEQTKTAANDGAKCASTSKKEPGTLQRTSVYRTLSNFMVHGEPAKSRVLQPASRPPREEADEIWVDGPKLPEW